MTTPDPDTAPIFVVGTGRSGSTLLRLLLCAHPRIYVAHEASFYVWEALYPKKAPRRAFLDYFFQTFSFRWQGVDPAEVVAGLPDPLPTERVGEAFGAMMRLKAAQYGRPRYGDKTPSHAASLKRIFEDFPDARVIHIVRDPRGTVLSLSRMPWASASLWADAAFLEVERKQVLPFRDRLLEVRLEDLLADPRSEMGRVLEHVGEAWDEAVLDHPAHIPDHADMPPLPWLSSARRPLGKPGARWESMPPVHIRLVEWLTRHWMKQYGYERAALAQEPGRPKVAWAGLRSLPEAVRFAWQYIRLGLRYRDPRNFESAETTRLFHTLNRESWSLYEDFEEMPRPPALPRSIP